MTSSVLERGIRRNLSDADLISGPIGVPTVEAKGYYVDVPSRGVRLILTTMAERDLSKILPVLGSLARLLTLEPNWDSYGAARVEHWAIEAAARLAMQAMVSNAGAPQIVPTNRGGVQLEWHAHGVDLEIEIESPSAISLFYEDARTEQQIVSDEAIDSRVVEDLFHRLGHRSSENPTNLA